MPQFIEYIHAMGEGSFTTTRGSIYRLTPNGIAKASFCPAVSEPLEDVVEAVSGLFAGAGTKTRELWLMEHPMNKLDDEAIGAMATRAVKAVEGARHVKCYYEPKATFLIDLMDSEWKPKKKVRQNCRNFEKLGGTVEVVATEGAMEEYRRLYIESRESLGLIPWPEGCFDTIWSWIEGKTDYAYVVVARLNNGSVIGGMSFLVGDGWVDEAHVARAENLPQRCYPMEPIRMKGIEIARGLGHRYYNLGGVAPNPNAGSKEEGIRRNKAKYNGTYYEYRRYYIAVT